MTKLRGYEEESPEFGKDRTSYRTGLCDHSAPVGLGQKLRSKDVHGNPEKRLQPILNTRKIHQTGVRSWIDQQVEIARLVIFPMENRTKYTRVGAPVLTHDLANFVAMKF